MAKCGFCKREFSNAQGVRAHLKHCHLYKGRGESPKNLPTQPRTQVSEEKHLNQLWRDARHSQGARVYSLPASSYTKERNITRSKHPQNSAHPIPRLTPDRIEENRRQVELEKEKEGERQATQPQEHRKRQLIQQIKFNVVDLYWQGMDLSVETKVGAKMAIEKKLLELPILELPYYEVQQIGEAIRDRIYSRYRQSQSVPQIQPQKGEIVMPITKVLSGFFYCPECDSDYELDRTPENEARCPSCRIALVEDLDQGEEQDSD